MTAALIATARLLSLGLAPPDGEALAELRALALGLAGGDEVEPELGELLAELARLEPDPAEYTRLFDGEGLCPPAEGSWERDPFRSTREIADVAGFYRAFGADASGERADHASVELEFLAFLALRRARAEGEEAETCRKAEDAFLRDHLGRWLHAFFGELLRETRSPFYAVLAAAGERWLAAELEARRLVPRPVAGRSRTSVEGDAVECGAAGLAKPF
jgi:TorA maturation chaperone TorD